jgi:hypothetical protein
MIKINDPDVVNSLTNDPLMNIKSVQEYEQEKSICPTYNNNYIPPYVGQDSETRQEIKRNIYILILSGYLITLSLLIVGMAFSSVYFGLLLNEVTSFAIGGLPIGIFFLAIYKVIFITWDKDFFLFCGVNMAMTFITMMFGIAWYVISSQIFDLDLTYLTISVVLYYTVGMIYKIWLLRKLTVNVQWIKQC